MDYNGPRYVKGLWNVICDHCGFQYKSKDLQREWTGLRVCRSCYEPRHPQEFVKGKADRQSVPWSRPDSDGTDVSVGSGNEVSQDDL